MKRILIAAILFLSLTTLKVKGQMLSFITDSVDNYITEGMKDWDLPGLSVVIIKDGKIIISKGYGVRDIETKEPVDDKTLFMIASNTKLFTGTSLAQLEFDKKLSINDKITKYFPDYKLYDPITTQQLTIRDLLSHRIGTKTFQGDFTFWNSTLTRKEIMQKMRLLKPVGIFRQNYGYCNSCFLTAGQVISKVTNKTWEQYVQDSILTPLQMYSTSPVSAGIEKRENVASPYSTSFTGKLNRVPYDQWDNLGPAASIVSSVSDLSHWLQFQLDSGRYKSQQIMPFSVLEKTRDVNIIASSRKSSILPTHFRGYGLGIFVADYNGRQIYWHTGGAAGMVSNVCFVPEENLGIAILTNNDNQRFFEALRYQILDAYLGVEYVNRSKQFLPDFQKEMEEQLKEIENWKARVMQGKPSLSPANYIGTYFNELYGSITITKRQNDLALKFNNHKNLTATLKYMDNDEWLLQYDNIEYGIFAVKFKIVNNRVVSIDIKANDFVEYDPYTFTKK